MRFESFLDRAHQGTGLRGPRVLYHYTSWEAAESIIRSQRFRASAHDCTNDAKELAAADMAILEVIRPIEKTAVGLGRRVLRRFVETYDERRIARSNRVYLVCFSQKRDDPEQWREYGGDGTGVCLGVRLFGIPEPRVPGLTSGFFPVSYADEELRGQVDLWCGALLDVLARAEDTEYSVRLAVDALLVNATAWAIATKQPQWRNEQEVRMIFLVRDGQSVAPASYVKSGGAVNRFIEVPLTRLRRIPVEDFIVGPRQDLEAGTERAIRLLAELEYPRLESKVFSSSLALSAIVW